MRRTAFLTAILVLLVSVAAENGAAQAPSSQQCQQVGPGRIYWHYTCVRPEFDRIVAAHPDIAKYATIGSSVMNNPIYVLEVTNFANTSAKPSFYLDATHHGNEVQGTEGAMILARKLTSEYATNPQVKRWVDSFDIFINPVVNPDGNILNQRYNYNNVDLNRNYPFQFGARATQAGSGPASEPETKANIAFMQAHSLDVYVSLHTGTWDFVLPRCDPGTFRGRVPTDDEQLYEYVSAELLNVTTGMGTRGASGTGESICWAYDVVETFSILPEVSTEQSVLFSPTDTVELNHAMDAIYWLLDRTGRFGANLDASLVDSDAGAVGIRIHNAGLQAATNWSLEVNYEGSKRTPLLRGNQPIGPDQEIVVPVPANYLQGNVHALLRYEHLNVNPLAAEPQFGRPRDPQIQWLNFTKEQAQKVAQQAPDAAPAKSPMLAPTTLALTVAIIALLRRR